MKEKMKEKMKENHFIQFMLMPFFIFLVNYFFNTSISGAVKSPAIYGDIMLGFNFLIIMGFILLLGCDAANTNFLPLYIKKKSKAFGDFFSWNKRYFLSSLFVFISFVLISFILLFFLHPKRLKILIELHVIVFFMFVAPLCSINIYLGSIILAFKKYYSSLVFSFFVRILSVVIFLIFGFFIEIYHPIQVLFVIILAMCITILLQILFLIYHRKHFEIFHKHIINFKIKKNKISKKLKSKWRTFAIKSLFTNLMLFSLPFINICMLEIFDKNQHEVGIFAAIMSINYIVIAMIIQITFFLFPNVNLLMKTNQKNKLQKLINKLNIYIIIYFCIYILMMLLFGKNILNLFGRGYIVYYNLFMLSLFLSTIGLFFSKSCTLSIGTGNQSILVKLNCIQLIFLIIFLPFVVMRFGLLGIIVFNFTLQNLIYIILAYIIHKKIGLKSFFLF